MNNTALRTITGVGIGVVLLSAFFLLPAWCLPLFLVIVCAYILFFEWPLFCKGWTQWLWLFAPFYIVWPFLFILILSCTQGGRQELALMCLGAFSFDTGAYFAGSWWGRNFIAPSISPKKSWEGFLGGLGVTGITVLLWNLFFVGATMGHGHWLYRTLWLGIGAFVGDFFESWLKRKAGLKDSGTLLPGHGGVLDRVDSIIGIIYVLFFYQWCLKL